MPPSPLLASPGPPSPAGESPAARQRGRASPGAVDERFDVPFTIAVLRVLSFVSTGHPMPSRERDLCRFRPFSPLGPPGVGAGRAGSRGCRCGCQACSCHDPVPARRQRFKSSSAPGSPGDTANRANCMFRETQTCPPKESPREAGLRRPLRLAPGACGPRPSASPATAAASATSSAPWSSRRKELN